MRSLSQALRLGSLHLASPGLSGAAISPQGCIPLALRPKGSSPACTGNGIFHPFHHHASWRILISIAYAFLRAELARERQLLPDEDFTVNGRLLEAWAGQKSFTRKQAAPTQEPP
jgi:hypothetical protein